METAQPHHNELSQRVAAGDSKALAEAFAGVRDRLRRMIDLRIDPRLRGRLDPDDLLQECFLEAAARTDHFALKQQEDPPLGLYLWLRMITLQSLADAHRRHLDAQMRSVKREVGPPRQTGSDTTALFAGALAANITSPSQAARRNEANEGLRNALEKLPEIDREVLALRHFEELSNSEVAQVLGIQVKAASIRYIRALQRLKAIAVTEGIRIDSSAG